MQVITSVALLLGSREPSSDAEAPLKLIRRPYFLYEGYTEKLKTDEQILNLSAK
jgi:hypothetical protein